MKKKKKHYYQEYIILLIKSLEDFMKIIFYIITYIFIIKL